MSLTLVTMPLILLSMLWMWRVLVLDWIVVGLAYLGFVVQMIAVVAVVVVNRLVCCV